LLKSAYGSTKNEDDVASIHLNQTLLMSIEGKNMLIFKFKTSSNLKNQEFNFNLKFDFYIKGKVIDDVARSGTY